MRLLSLLLFLTTSKVIQINAKPVETIIEAYRCEDSSSRTCTLRGLIFGKKDSGRFLPKSNNPSYVTTVEFVSSGITFLTSDICETFPNLEILKVNNISLETINEGALDACPKLKEIYLQDNKIESLPKSLFKENKQLEKIILNNNDLKKIDEELFKGLKNLKWIDLCSNSLSRLPVKAFTGLESMYNLEVRNNPLLSLEIEHLKEVMPRLKYVLLRDIDVTCDRMKEIDNFCVDNGIDYLVRDDYSDYHSKSTDFYIRKRSYEVIEVNNFECLSKEQHEREVLLRETLTNLLTSNGTDLSVITSRRGQNDFMDVYDKKFEELSRKIESTESNYVMKIFEAQNFMLKLMKDKLEEQDVQINLLKKAIKQDSGLVDSNIVYE